ncbi:MAG: glycosyl hydrolase [Ruminiclostridium sp.]
MLKRIISAICAFSLALSWLNFTCFAAEKTLVYEAEDSVLNGLTIESGKDYSGGKCVSIKSSGNCTFTIKIPETGLYDFNFVSSGTGGDKINKAALDGELIGEFATGAEKLGDAVISAVYAEKGTHKVRVSCSWGWINLDCLKITPSAPSKDYYAVSDQLINPNASKEAKELMSFLADCYGKYVITGQQCEGMNSTEYKAITAATDKSPAIIGLDLMDYTPSRVKKGTSCKTVEQAIEFSDAGGIVTICWHWGAPEKYIKNGTDKNGNPAWWGGFYTDNVNMDFAKIMNKTDKEGYDLLMSDIDAIAVQLKKLCDAGVPVLFRPLHEASGGWFWWGSGGAEAYKKLWKTMYKKLTGEHGLNNLIWVWNGQNADWYPGDEYVDIIGEDIYPGTRIYSPQSSKFVEAADYTKSTKIVSLSENGCLFDIDKAAAAGTLWSWFCVWGGEFAVSGSTLSGKYTETSMWKTVYNHEKALTLDEVIALRSAAQKTDISKAKVSGLTSKTWTGKAVKPAIKVTVNGNTLTKNTDYTVSYKNNTNVGTATVTITGKGDYKGTLTKTFRIIPPQEKIKSISALEGGFKVTYTKQTPATGYQIQYSTSKTMSSASSKSFKSAVGSITGLKSGKTYYVRVRSYTVVNGKKIYGTWSTVKSVKAG